MGLSLRGLATKEGDDGGWVMMHVVGHVKPPCCYHDDAAAAAAAAAADGCCC